MAIISDIEAEAGFNVMIRWFAKASQRYPANENDYYMTVFPMLEPNQDFMLSDPRFDLDFVNDEDAELEYTIRDICYVRTLIPQFIGFTYYQPDYRQYGDEDTPISLTAVAMGGLSTIEVNDSTFFVVGDNVQIGPRPTDVATIADITGTVVTLDRVLNRNFPIGTAVNQYPTVTISGDITYPDTTPAATIARIFDTTGNLVTDPIEVNTPIFFDTSETVLRYYYSSTLDQPVNGARGPGDTEDQQIMHNGQLIFGGWWAFGDFDNTAANRAELIDNQGFVLDVRDGDHAFDQLLRFSETENGACTSTDTTLYYTNHSDWQSEPPNGVSSFINVDGSSPRAGFYAGVSDDPGDLGQSFVKYWNGNAFEADRVEIGRTVDNCPLALQNSLMVTTYGNEQDLACNTGGTSSTVYFTGDTFLPNQVGLIYTDQFGPNSDTPSQLGATFISANSQNYVWNGENLIISSVVCVMNRYCADPSALNTMGRPATNPVIDNSLCVYPRTICTDSAATNFVSSGDRLATDIINNGTCTFPPGVPTFTVTLTINNQIQGGAQNTAYRINGRTAQAGPEGASFTWNGEISVTALDGHQFTSGPTITYSGNVSGNFVDGFNAPATATITGTVEQVANTPVGCNISSAANYVAGSDGSVPCAYLHQANPFYGTSDIIACAGSGGRQNVYRNTEAAGGGTRYFNNISLDSPADGFYSDMSSWTRYSSGNIAGTGSCAPARSISGLNFTRFTATGDALSIHEGSIGFSSTGSFPGGFNVDVAVTAGEVTSIRPSNPSTSTARDFNYRILPSVAANLPSGTSNFTVTATVTAADNGELLGRVSRTFGAVSNNPRF